jgi:hypothetical protein
MMVRLLVLGNVGAGKSTLLELLDQARHPQPLAPHATNLSGASGATAGDVGDAGDAGDAGSQCTNESKDDNDMPPLVRGVSDDESTDSEAFAPETRSRSGFLDTRKIGDTGEVLSGATDLDESQQSEVSRAPRWKERKFVMVHGRVPNGDFNRISQALAGTHPIHFVNGRGMLFDPKSIHNDYSSNEWNSYTYGAAANRSRASDAMMLDHQNMQMSSVDPEWCVFGS